MTLPSDQIPQPLQNIGCQDLLTEEYTHCGWLRKQHFFSKLKIFKWPQVYVVISKGCVYYFRNEYSNSTSGKFSLYGYNTVHREEIKSMSWVFKIVHTHSEEFKTYYFSASSEKEMKEWMRLIKAELVTANGQQGKEENYYYTYRSYGGGMKVVEEDKNSLTYQDIEADIYDDSSKFRRPKNYGKNHEVKRTNEASDDEDIPDIPAPEPTNRISDASTVSGSSTSSGYFSDDRRPPMPLPNVPPPIPERGATSSTPTGKKKRKKRQRSKDDPTISPGPSLPAGLVDEVSKRAQELSISAEGQRDQPTGARRKGSQPLPPPDPEPEPAPEPQREEEAEEVDDETYWESIYFRDPSNERASEIIRDIGEDGVYLVREGAQGGQVLVVFANNMPKKYKVHNVEGQYFLGREGPKCDTLENLLYEYYHRDLPTANVRLTLPYKLHSKYKMLPKSS